MKMAALPSPTQVAGKQYNLYEAYFSSVEKQGVVPAAVAAKFLKTSGLSDAILSKIWDLSDPNAKGCLNRMGFFVALKLVSLAQLGHEVSINNLMMEVSPPNMRGTPPPNLNVSAPEPLPVTSDWSMKASEKVKYEQLFQSLQPINGVIPGHKVKGLLIDSKLPVLTLGKIWDLADMDKDGSLDKHEFIIAMHLVYKALEKYTIPNTLPPELLPPTKEVSSVTPPTVTPPPTMNGLSGPVWVVSSEEKAKYDNLFLRTDVDKDGYVSGLEIKDVFLQSGVPQSVLASIWALCDIKQSGKLNAEQFALAMWLIQQKLSGHDPPATLSPNMVPPSFRNNQTQNEPAASVYSNPELDMITKDIEELNQDKQILEAEIMHKEAEIKIRSSEAKSLQGELDTLAATLKQLENQKGEAQKRLNDLKNQVDKLKKDAEEQEALVKTQEEELSNKKQELETLKIEESKLEARQSELAKILNDLSNNLQESQLTISQVKTKIIEIQDHQKLLKDAIAIADNALSEGDVTTVPQRYLQIEAEFKDLSYTKLLAPTQNINSSATTQREDIKPKPQEDLFANNAFSNGNDMFTSHDSFASAFSTNVSSAFGQDPFSSFGAPAAKPDPFDPFGGSNKNSTPNSVVDSGEDPFGCEPFATPAPALPPKNKQPPPRPAPPRPAPPPSQTSNPTTNDSFADFSAFNKGPKLEFTEDPFKDYRYEDPFSIEDPFKDVPDPLSDTNHTSVDGSHDPFLDDRTFFVSRDFPTLDVSRNFFGNGKVKSQEHLSDISKLNVLGDDNIKLKLNVKENVVVKCDSLPILLL